MIYSVLVSFVTGKREFNKGNLLASLAQNHMNSTREIYWLLLFKTTLIYCKTYFSCNILI